MSETIREAFQNWHVSEYGAEPEWSSTGYYTDKIHQWRWQGFQAAMSQRIVTDGDGKGEGR